MNFRHSIWIVGLALGLSTSALAQDFNTGSSLMNTGSTYSSTIYGVGATSVDPMAGTVKSGRGRMVDSDDDDEPSSWDDVGDFTPIGDAWSLLLFAGAAAGFVALRRRKLKVRGER